jgi:hypothetical protein
MVCQSHGLAGLCFELQSIFPGTPKTVTLGGTSAITTVLAPTVALSPTVTLPMTLAPADIVTLSPIVGESVRLLKPMVTF